MVPTKPCQWKSFKTGIESFFQIRNTPDGKNMICSSSRLLHVVKLLHGLVSRDTDAALGPKKVIVLKVKVQKEVKYNRLLELGLGWFWFTSDKTPWEEAMPSKPSGWTKKISFLQRVQCIQILSSKPLLLCRTTQSPDSWHRPNESNFGWDLIEGHTPWLARKVLTSSAGLWKEILWEVFNPLKHTYA